MENGLFIACDIGNSCVTYGFFKHGNLVSATSFSSAPETDLNLMVSAFSKFRDENKIKKGTISSALISSVVPHLTRFTQIALETVFGIKASIFDSTFKTGITLSIDNPNEVGADLIADVVGAVYVHHAYPCAIVDLGTVTKNILVGKDKDLLGCSFFPGLQSCLSAMSHAAALLPEVNEFIVPKTLIGKNTIDAMSSGIFYGTIEGILGYTHRIDREFKQEVTKILTGGYTSIVASSLPGFIVDQYLVLKGLYIISTFN